MGFSKQEYWSGVPLPSPNYMSTLYYKYNCIVVVMSNSLRPHGLQRARLTVHHQLPEPAQSHVHRVGGAIQPSHSLLIPSPPAHNLSQHQVLFQ